MITVAKCFTRMVLLILSPIDSDAASIDHLYCNNEYTAYVDANSGALLERATLNRDRFTGVVCLGLDPHPAFIHWSEKILRDARRDLTLGFRLDDGAVTPGYFSLTGPKPVGT